MGKDKVTIDNRDLDTTWLWVDQLTLGPIEVDPWELVENALENAGLEHLIQRLMEIKKEAEAVQR